jgi:hypothetical protein
VGARAAEASATIFSEWQEAQPAVLVPAAGVTELIFGLGLRASTLEEGHAYCCGAVCGCCGCCCCSAGGGYCSDWSLEHLLADSPTSAIAATAATNRDLFMMMSPLPERTNEGVRWFPRQAAGSSSLARKPPSGEGSSSNRPL